MDFFKNNLVAGVGVAFAAAVLAPILIPSVSRAGRPFAKSLVRGGMAMYDKGREIVALAGESVEDLMAEIRAEGAAPAAEAGAVAPVSDPHAERRRAGDGAAPGAGNGAADLAAAAI